MRALRDNDEQVVVTSCPSTLLVSLPIILSHIETGKNDCSHLDAREVVVVADGRNNKKKITSSLRLDTREVVVVADGRNSRKNYLQLAFQREGDGGGGRRVDLKNERNHLRLAFGCEEGGGGRRVERTKKNHLRLVFGREGGGGCGRRVGRTKMTTSGSHWDTREVVVVGVASKRRKEPPPARIWTRGRWWW
jgi:hypothetical protein